MEIIQQDRRVEAPKGPDLAGLAAIITAAGAIISPIIAKLLDRGPDPALENLAREVRAIRSAPGPAAGALADAMNGIREVVNVYRRRPRAKEPRQQTVLTRMNEIQERLVERSREQARFRLLHRTDSRAPLVASRERSEAVGTIIDDEHLHRGLRLSHSNGWTMAAPAGDVTPVGTP